VATNVEEYRAKAQQCEQLAEMVRDLEIQGQLLDVARQWRELATPS